MKSEYISKDGPKPKRYRVNKTKGYNPKGPASYEERHSIQGGSRTINKSGDAKKIRKNWETGQRRASKGKYF